MKSCRDHIAGFLYKGEYETISYADTQAETQRIEIEYKRSIQVYYAARKFGICGLDTLAQNYIMALSESLSIFQILRGARLIFSKLREDEEWFHKYLHSELSSSFAADETTFQLDEFYSNILNDPVFSKAVLKYVVKAFTTETSRLRNGLRATDVGSETKKDCGEPSCEKLATGPLFEPPGGRNRGSGWVPPHKRSRAANKSSTHDVEQPCGEPAIELLPADSEEATSTGFSWSRSYHDDLSFLGTKERRRMRLAQ